MISCWSPVGVGGVIGVIGVGGRSSRPPAGSSRSLPVVHVGLVLVMLWLMAGWDCVCLVSIVHRRSDENRSGDNKRF